MSYHPPEDGQQQEAVGKRYAFEECGEDDWGGISRYFQYQAQYEVEKRRLGVVVPETPEKVIPKGGGIQVLPVFEQGVESQVDAEQRRQDP
jgi:hypothetical protein